jgi:acetolactate synthase small subunit
VDCGIVMILKGKIYQITEQLEKLAEKIKVWKSNNLMFERKLLILKTFGLSQLIYFLKA